MPEKIEMEIIKHQAVSPEVRRLTLAGEITAQPGQFVQVGVTTSYDPFLKRPLSVHDWRAGELTLLYRLAGRGTCLLSAKKVGESVTVVGPLGQGFPLGGQRPAIVVAGGIGAAPLFFLLRSLQAAGKEVTFFYGARSAAELVLREQFQALATSYVEATDDGSLGRKGLVTDLLQAALLTDKADIYACGPEPMLRAVAKLAAGYQCRCYVSLEAQMACGVGACLGCVIPSTNGTYVRVCVDGPVFAAEEVFAE
ncbi:MAG TPA: dihydroorotate dehydrogenase electron transfer subunit [Oscillospiraceae bacterium]|nr:dihydroorotate dehydrogenase electron transfer subunit [Oscillospiraceae bacterium]